MAAAHWHDFIAALVGTTMAASISAQLRPHCPERLAALLRPATRWFVFNILRKGFSPSSKTSMSTTCLPSTVPPRRCHRPPAYQWPLFPMATFLINSCLVKFVRGFCRGEQEEEFDHFYFIQQRWEAAGKWSEMVVAEVGRRERWDRKDEWE